MEIKEIIQYHKSETITPLRQRCMDTMQKLGLPYRLIDKQPYPAETRPDLRFETDETRARIAIENPYALILDSDMVATGVPFVPEQTGKPYFFRHDQCGIYVNGCTDFFKTMMEWYDERKKTLQIGWFQRYIRTHEHFDIPEKCFVHLSLGMFGEKATCATARFAMFQRNGETVFELR